MYIYSFNAYTIPIYTPIYRPDDLDGGEDDDSDEVDEDDNVILEYSSSLGEWMVGYYCSVIYVCIV